MKDQLNILGYVVSQAMRGLQKDLEIRFREKDVLVTYEQWTIISCFRDNLEMKFSQQEIAEKTGRDQPCTSRLINNLVKQDLLMRVLDEKDRRVNKIHLTQKGKDLVTSTTCIAQQAIMEATEGIDQEELEICKRVLQEVSRNLENIKNRS